MFREMFVTFEVICPVVFSWDVQRYFRGCFVNAFVALFVSCFVASSDQGFVTFAALPRHVRWHRTRRRIKEPWAQNASNDYRENIIANNFAIVSTICCVMGSCGN